MGIEEHFGTLLSFCYSTYLLLLQFLFIVPFHV